MFAQVSQLLQQDHLGTNIVGLISVESLKQAELTRDIISAEIETEDIQDFESKTRSNTDLIDLNALLEQASKQLD